MIHSSDSPSVGYELWVVATLAVLYVCDKIGLPNFVQYGVIIASFALLFYFC